MNQSDCYKPLSNRIHMRGLVSAELSHKFATLRRAYELKYFVFTSCLITRLKFRCISRYNLYTWQHLMQIRNRRIASVTPKDEFLTDKLQFKFWKYISPRPLFYFILWRSIIHIFIGPVVLRAPLFSLACVKTNCIFMKHNISLIVWQ